MPICHLCNGCLGRSCRRANLYQWALSVVLSHCWLTYLARSFLKLSDKTSLRLAGPNNTVGARPAGWQMSFNQVLWGRLFGVWSLSIYDIYPAFQELRGQSISSLFIGRASFFSIAAAWLFWVGSLFWDRSHYSHVILPRNSWDSPV